MVILWFPVHQLKENAAEILKKPYLLVYFVLKTSSAYKCTYICFFSKYNKLHCGITLTPLYSLSIHLNVYYVFKPIKRPIFMLQCSFLFISKEIFIFMTSYKLVISNYKGLYNTNIWMSTALWGISGNAWNHLNMAFWWHFHRVWMERRDSANVKCVKSS